MNGINVLFRMFWSIRHTHTGVKRLTFSGTCLSAFNTETKQQEKIEAQWKQH